MNQRLTASSCSSQTPLSPVFPPHPSVCLQKQAEQAHLQLPQQFSRDLGLQPARHLEMLRSLTPETTPTCKQPRGTCPEQGARVSAASAAPAPPFAAPGKICLPYGGESHIPR